MRSVEVKILGQSYSIKTEEDEAYIKALAEYVDTKLKEIFSAAPNVNHVKEQLWLLSELQTNCSSSG